MPNHPNRTKSNRRAASNPRPAEIVRLREAARLTQTEAGELVHTTCRVFQQWEAGDRRMHPAFWELFERKVKEKGFQARRSA